MRLQKTFSIVVLIVTNLFTQGQVTSNKSTTTSKPTILFVCEHGAGRSAIAAAFFNKMAKEKKLNYEAIFRGIHPDSSFPIFAFRLFWFSKILRQLKQLV